MQDEPTKRVWGWADRDTKWEQTLGPVLFQPFVDFVVRAGEIMVLAGAFRFAARATHSIILTIFSAIMLTALGAHLGMGFGRYISYPLRGREAKATWLNFVLLCIAGSALGLLWFFLWQQIVVATDSLVANGAHS